MECLMSVPPGGLVRPYDCSNRGIPVHPRRCSRFRIFYSPPPVTVLSLGVGRVVRPRSFPFAPPQSCKRPLLYHRIRQKTTRLSHGVGTVKYFK